MSDIFLSYASTDRDRAKDLASFLEARGYSVWWDRTIPPGRVFDEVIQEAIGSARCVLVLWSRESAASNWVKTEAAEALSRNILIPVLIERTTVPIAFRRIQAADLTGGRLSEDRPEVEKLLRSIQQLTRGVSPGETVAVLSGPGASRPSTAPGYLWITGAALAGVLLLGAGWVLGSRYSHRERLADEPELERTNILAARSGGHIVVASSEYWTRLIDGEETSCAWVDKGEGVFEFEKSRKARFDAFALFVGQTANYNVGQFELQAGDDLKKPMRVLGRFQPTNMRTFPNPFQEFKFPAITARYLKFKSLSNQAGEPSASTCEFQLFGSLQ